LESFQVFEKTGILLDDDHFLRTRTEQNRTEQSRAEQSRT